jgi:D-proline reductase (dithiol) PrdB
MVRLEKLSPIEREVVTLLVPPSFDTQPWVSGPPLNRRRVALINTAGLRLRHDRPFMIDPDDFYRIIPGDVKANDLVLSHPSPGFDRSAFQRDWNVVFPLDRLRELAAEGIIGSVAGFHYSFAGIRPETMAAPAREIAGLLKKDKVDAVLLLPV